MNVMIAGDAMFALTETDQLNRIDMNDLSTIYHVGQGHLKNGRNCYVF